MYFHSCGNSLPWSIARPREFNYKWFQQPKLYLKAGKDLHT